MFYMFYDLDEFFFTLSFSHAFNLYAWHILFALKLYDLSFYISCYKV